MRLDPRGVRRDDEVMPSEREMGRDGYVIRFLDDEALPIRNVVALVVTDASAVGFVVTDGVSPDALRALERRHGKPSKVQSVDSFDATIDTVFWGDSGSLVQSAGDFFGVRKRPTISAYTNGLLRQLVGG